MIYKLAGILLSVMILSVTLVTALTNSTIQCVDEYTLEENITVGLDGNESTASLTKHCPNGCDNITGSCNLPVYQEGIIVFIAVLLIVIGVVKGAKWVRRG